MIAQDFVNRWIMEIKKAKFLEEMKTGKKRI